MDPTFEEQTLPVESRRIVERMRATLMGQTARLCAAARVLVRHGDGLDPAAGALLLAEIDDAANGLQQAITRLEARPA